MDAISDFCIYKNRIRWIKGGALERPQRIDYMEGILMKGKALLRTSIVVIAAIGLAGASAADARSKSRGETALVDPAVVITVDAPKGVNAYISHPLIPVTFSGLWYIAPGSYTIRREAHVDGRRFALIPWARRQPDARLILEEKKDTAGCRANVQHFAAIDMDTQELHDRTWIFTRSDCDIGDRWDQRFWLAPGYSADGFQVRQESASAVAERRAAGQRAAQLAEQREHEAKREERRQHEELMQAEAPAKRQIGATVCQKGNVTGYAGYTEQVSPDTGRIRVRIVRHFESSTGRFLMTRPPEENVWDDPDNWYLCDF